MSTFSYRDQLAYVSRLRIVDGGTMRCRCMCGGKNTLGVTRRGSELIWGCFRASCDVAGTKGGDDSLGGVKRRLEDTSSPSMILRPVPATLTSVRSHPAILTWLASVHTLAAFEAGLVEVRYSPLEDRVMFPVGSLGYTGRARQGVKPKWIKYGDCSTLFTCGTGKTGVVVEDAPSACAVGILPQYTGLSILGTQLSVEHIMGLRGYERVLVCLDPDAMLKGLSFVSRIEGTVRASLRMIDDDLKYYEPEQIERMLHE